MPDTYWLDRKRSALAMADDAASAEARLIHFQLAGSYSLKAMAARRGRKQRRLPTAVSEPETAEAAYCRPLGTGGPGLALQSVAPTAREERPGIAGACLRRAAGGESL